VSVSMLPPMLDDNDVTSWTTCFLFVLTMLGIVGSVDEII